MTPKPVLIFAWFVALSAAPIAFPLDLWTGLTDRYLRRVAGGVLVRTPRARNTLAATDPALLAATGGKYRFALRYKLVNGEAGLGASIGDGSPWLTLSAAGHQADNDHEVDVWVDLKSGQEIHLGIMNGGEGPPATFLMKAVTAVEVLDSAGTRERAPQ